MNRKQILLGVVPAVAIGGTGLGYYIMMMRKKVITVKVVPADITICKDYQAITVTAKNGLGQPLANTAGVLTCYVGGVKSTEFTFTTGADGTYSTSLCWYSSVSQTITTTTYIPLSYVATIAGAVGSGNGRLVLPAGTVLPCTCPT